MKGQLLKINPVRNKSAARADLFGAGVLPNLTAYTVTPLTLNAPNLPVGYELGPSTFHLLPGYKTGIALRVGTKNTTWNWQGYRFWNANYHLCA